MANGHHLETSKTTISPQWFDWSAQNLVWWRTLALGIRCWAYTNDCFRFLRRQWRLRELLETKQQLNKATIPPIKSGIFQTCPNKRPSLFVSLYESERNQTKQNELKLAVQTITNQPERCR